MQVFNVVPTFLEVSLVAGILAYKCGPAFAGLTAATITLYTLVTFAITSVSPPSSSPPLPPSSPPLPPSPLPSPPLPLPLPLPAHLQPLGLSINLRAVVTQLLLGSF